MQKIILYYYLLHFKLNINVKKTIALSKVLPGIQTRDFSVECLYYTQYTIRLLTKKWGKAVIFNSNSPSFALILNLIF